MTTKAATATAASILDASQQIMQAVGYNGLSFRDVAAAVGIKSASVHYHYPTKAQLAAAVTRRYTDGLSEQLRLVDGSLSTPRDALAAYVATVRRTLETDGRICLGGILAAETDALPVEVRIEVQRFIDLNVDWLAGMIHQVTGQPAESDGVRDHALALFGALQGAMLIARGAGDFSRFDAMTAQFARAGLWPK